MKISTGLWSVLALTLLSASLSSAAVCPVTANTNTDCGYLITIGSGGAITGAPVAGANPYDGADDALIGIINNSGAVYTGSIALTGSGNGGGIFAFDGDGICVYVSNSGCGATGYEGPGVTFSGINAAGTSGTVNIAGLAAGGTTFFSLEGSPASIGNIGVGAPEPTTFALLGLTGLTGLVLTGRRRKA